MDSLWKQPYMKKVGAIAILVSLLYVFRHVLNLLLLTFIFSYLFYTVHAILTKRLPKVMAKFEKTWHFIIYGVFLLSVSWVGYRYAPIAGKQLAEVFTQIANFRVDQYADSLHPKLYEMVKEINVGHYIRESGNYLLTLIANISSFMLQVAIALLLSLFFNLERRTIAQFMRRFKDSKVSFLYDYYVEFGKNFLNTFGKVVQIQIIISFVNTILSVIMLKILGFPQVIGLGVMIFFLGLIPVAGVIISLIPLSLIAFQIGGWVKIFHLLIMIAVIHAVESYFLNPKLYSVKMKLPVFFTFLILIVSEHVMGVWGLLIGIPLFMFLLDLLKVPEQPNKE